jgi:hypothetical protein
MPLAQQEQDPWTGRYISSQENTKDLAGLLGSVPGAFNELTKTTPGASDTAKAIETPETLERSEADETVKILEGILI